jgi:heptosyltransferase-3
VRILFIKPKYIGDTLLLTPTIAATRRAYPAAEIWVLVRRGCEGILSGCPGIHRILTVAEAAECARAKHSWWLDVRTLLELRKVDFDYVFELGDGHRARWFALFTRRKKLFSVNPTGPLNWFWRRQFDGIATFNWQHRHRVEKDFLSVNEFLPLPPPVPGLIFERSRAATWPVASTLESFAVLHIGTSQAHKEWVYESWVKVGRHLLEHLSGVIISTGPAVAEVAQAKRLRAALGTRVTCTLGATSWAELAGLLYRARLFVGVDTAAMHLAAACQCPIVALFGPTIEMHWHPWQADYRIIAQPDWNMEKSHPNHFTGILQRPMRKIETERVITACDSFLNRTELIPAIRAGTAQLSG